MRVRSPVVVFSACKLFDITAEFPSDGCPLIHHEMKRWESEMAVAMEVERPSFGFVGGSFRSEDSEVLALWEEKCQSPKLAVSTELQQKPRLSVDSSLSPWRYWRKIESLSHTVFSRSSPVHNMQAAAAGESPRPSLEYLMKQGDGRRSSWRDFKIMSSPARSCSTESSTVLHNSPKARYRCRVVKRTDHELLEVPEKRQSRVVEFDQRRKLATSRRDGSHEKWTQGESLDERELCCSESGSERRIAEAMAKSGHDAGKPSPALPPRSYSLNLPKPDSAVSSSASRRSCAVVPSDRRQTSKMSALPTTTSMERCGDVNRTRSQSMDEAMLNEYASEGGVQHARQEGRCMSTHEPVSRKASHRYYQRVTSRERNTTSSRWGSGDDTPLDHIDFVAPSAVRFLEDHDETLPVKSPVKTPGAVPFKWEQVPGKPLNSEPAAAAAATPSAPQCSPGSPLQLPPRLALRKQHSSPLRERYIDMSMSAPLAELYQKSPEPLKVQLPWIESPASESPITKSRSAGDFSSSLSLPGAPCSQRKPIVRPGSPTSILCGPCDGSHPSSLGSEQEAPTVSGATFRGLSTCASFDSMEQRSLSPESSLTSPLRANTRCNSIEHTRSMDIQKVAGSENAFVKLCRTGKRWMTKSKTHSKLGTIYSPEIWTPVRFVDRAEFSDRLDGHSHIQIIESRFRPSAPYIEDVGDRSPAYAATLELLSPKLDRVSSKRTSKLPRPTMKTTSRLRVRARLRARFLVPLRRALRTLISRCTFRRRRSSKIHVKAAGSIKPLYHVDYTLTHGEF